MYVTTHASKCTDNVISNDIEEQVWNVKQIDNVARMFKNVFFISLFYILYFRCHKIANKSILDTIAVQIAMCKVNKHAVLEIFITA